jgi:hypothetical protein
MREGGKRKRERKKKEKERKERRGKWGREIRIKKV